MPGALKFYVDEEPGQGVRVWNFALGFEEETTINVSTQRAGWSIPWESLRSQVLGVPHPEYASSDIARWLRGVTGDHMPATIEPELARNIGIWLVQHGAYFDAERVKLDSHGRG